MRVSTCPIQMSEAVAQVQVEEPAKYVSLCVLGHAALVALSAAPLVTYVEPNLNIVCTATLAVYVGCHRSLKEVRCVEAMTQGDAMRYVPSSR